MIIMMNTFIENNIIHKYTNDHKWLHANKDESNYNNVIFIMYIIL